MIPVELFSMTLRTLFAPVVPYLDDPSVSEIMINGPATIFIERKGQLERAPVKFESSAAVLAALRNVAQYAGSFIDEQHPILEARLPDGSRLEAVIDRGTRPERRDPALFTSEAHARSARRIRCAHR